MDRGACWATVQGVEESDMIEVTACAGGGGQWLYGKSLPLLGGLVGLPQAVDDLSLAALVS